MTHPGRCSPASDSGSITVWSLGLIIALLFVGGIGLDLWRGVSDRQRLVNIADAAATAGATAIDQGSVREDGEVALDQEVALDRAWASLASQEETSQIARAHVDVSPEHVMVTVDGVLNLTLLRVLYPAEALRFSVTGSAGPTVAGPG